jgi:Fe-S cluster assembly iron-binding protein IscA
MLTVTEAAKEKLKETLMANTNDQDSSLRLTMKPPGQLGLVVDKVSPADSVVEHEGTKVLVISNEIAELLQGAKLDVENTPDGKTLKIFQEQ